jgi:hypothetical protein
MLASDPAGREALRSTMLAKLAQRFVEAKIGTGGAEAPAFS